MPSQGGLGSGRKEGSSHRRCSVATDLGVSHSNLRIEDVHATTLQTVEHNNARVCIQGGDGVVRSAVHTLPCSQQRSKRESSQSVRERPFQLNTIHECDRMLAYQRVHASLPTTRSRSRKRTATRESNAGACYHVVQLSKGALTSLDVAVNSIGNENAKPPCLTAGRGNGKVFEGATTRTPCASESRGHNCVSSVSAIPIGPWMKMEGKEGYNYRIVCCV